MKPTPRLLATVKSVSNPTNKAKSRYLEAGNPTGLTGLFTHPSPRSALIFLYTSTLTKLSSIPSHSVYRQSVESVTNHRLRIVERIKPEGFDEWRVRSRKTIEAHPDVFSTDAGGNYMKSTVGGRTFIHIKVKQEPDERLEEWDGEGAAPASEDPKPFDEVRREGASEDSDSSVMDLVREFTAREKKGESRESLEKEARDKMDAVWLKEQELKVKDENKVVEWEEEPKLDSTQIEEIENQIGGGLIEEVIQVAEAELLLVDKMAEAKIWEELEDKAPPGQWDYFARDQHTPGTQETPNK